MFLVNWNSKPWPPLGKVTASCPCRATGVQGRNTPCGSPRDSLLQCTRELKGVRVGRPVEPSTACFEQMDCAAWSVSGSPPSLKVQEISRWLCSLRPPALSL